MKDDREWLRRQFDAAAEAKDLEAMKNCFEVALHRLYGQYIAVGDRDRRLGRAQQVMAGYQKQLEWAWQFVPEEVLTAQREESARIQKRAGEFIQAALDKREFDRLVADFDAGDGV